jgi:hypothetical protein
LPSPGEDQVAQVLIRAINNVSYGIAHVPVTPVNIALLGRWMANEGGTWANNPLNTSLDASSYPHQFAADGSDTGIPIYPTMTVGLDATATTLLSDAAYGPILQVLHSGHASCAKFARVVINSPWAAGHYNYDPAAFCSGIVPPARGPGRRVPRTHR